MQMSPGGISIGGAANFSMSSSQVQWISCDNHNALEIPTGISFVFTPSCQGGISNATETYPDARNPFSQQTAAAHSIPAYGTAWVSASTPPGATLTTDIVNDLVQVLLSGQTKVGNLQVTLNGDLPRSLATVPAAGANLYKYSFGRAALPAGTHYTSVTATWDGTSVTAPVGSAGGFKALGLYRFSQYNTPAESACGGKPTPVYIFENNQTCTYWYGVTLKSDFLQQVNLNGTGKSASFGLLKPYRTTLLGKSWCALPPGGSMDIDAGNTFVQVQVVDGSCNTAFQNGLSLATNPDPNADPTGQWQCGDSVLLVSPSNVNHSTRVAQDLCPACAGGFGGTKWPGTVGHIDSYNTLNFCKKNDPNNIDLGNFYGIRLR
jgi:hypothetical protein